MNFLFQKYRIYLDYAALTPVDPRVLRKVKQFSSPVFGNASAFSKEGVSAEKALAEARQSIARSIQAHADEIVFTSGGTEANGLALEGAARAAHRDGNQKLHLVISAIEHSSVIECAAMMERHGVEVTRLPVNSAGLISLDELKKALKPSTFMVSIMSVNNEIGSIQPIREIAKVIRQAREHVTKNARYPLFHTDAAQAPLYVDLNAEKLGVDLMTLDASKAYGPRGIGLLYVRRGTPIEPIIYGGGQEHGLRSGTENIPAIMGFACALEIAVHDRAAETERITALKECFWRELLAVEPRIRVQGPAPLGVLGRHFSRDDESAEVAMSLRHERSLPCAPHILNVSIPDIDNEFFVLQLDARGIACSTKSSCLRNEDESYVLRALGLDSRTSVRFSFGRWTKRRHVESAVRAIRRILAK